MTRVALGIYLMVLLLAVRRIAANHDVFCVLALSGRGILQCDLTSVLACYRSSPKHR